MNLASMLFVTGATGAICTTGWGGYRLAVLGCQFVGDRMAPQIEVHPCSPSLMQSVEKITAEAQFDEDVSDMANVMLEEIAEFLAREAA